MNNPSLEIMLRALHLPTILNFYQSFADTALANDWSYTQYLSALIAQEMEDRSHRRLERLLKQSDLPDGKSLEALNLKLFPPKVRCMVPTLVDGSFVERAENILIFGLPGRGKTHFASAIARELIMRHYHRVWSTKTFGLVQKLLRAKSELCLEELLGKLDRYDVILLDDIGYVQQSREEMEVLFTFLSERYERKSLIITSNLVFSEWDKIFKDPMTTAAAIDRLVHHSIIVELTGRSYRAFIAEQRAKEQKTIISSEKDESKE